MDLEHKIRKAAKIVKTVTQNEITLSEISAVLASLRSNLGAEIVSFTYDRDGFDLMFKKSGKVKVIRFSAEEHEKNLSDGFIEEVKQTALSQDSSKT